MDLAEFDDDDWLYDEEEEDFLEDEEGVKIDLTEFHVLADRKLKFHFACTFGNELRGESLAELLMAEAELFLNNCDYRSALVAALASDSVTQKISEPRKAIEAICLYQLGDRTGALQLSDTVNVDALLSPHLKKRFANTVEVLEFMPQWLSMLGQSR